MTVSPVAPAPSRAAVPTPPADVAPDALETARGLLRASWVLSVVVMVLAVGRGAPALSDGHGVLIALSFTAGALALWAVGARVQNHLLLRGALGSQVARGNLAAAVAAATHQVALAVITSHAVYGDRLEQLPAALVFGALAQASWGLLVLGFRWVTTYDDGQEIAGDNAAAAVSYGGAALALAVIVGHAVDGPFLSWAHSFRAYGAWLGWAVSLYPVRQLVVEGLFLGQRPHLRGGELDRAIGQRRSVGIAALEASAYAGAALLATGLA